MDFNFTDLIAYSGDFQDELIQTFEDRIEDMAVGFFVIQNVKSLLNMTFVEASATPKPFDGVFDNVDSITYIDRVLGVEKYQQDWSVLPGSFVQTHMAAKRKNERAGNMEIPYEQTVYDTCLKEIASVIVRQMLYHGIGKAPYAAFNPATAYTVGSRVKFVKANGSTRYYKCIVVTAAGQTPESHKTKWLDESPLAINIGLKKKLDDAVNAPGSTFVPVTTGSMATGTYGKVIDVYRGLSEKIRQTATEIWVCMAQNTKDNLLDDYEANYGKYTEKMDEMSILPKTDGKAKILVCPWLEGTDAVIACVPDVLLLGVDKPDDGKYIDAEKNKYNLDLMVSGVIGAGFKHPTGLSINDQALV